MNNKLLKEILMQKDVVKSINENIDKLLEIIPEIKDMIGFEHKHPHHHLDVWNHTLLALSRAPFDYEIRVILLVHDIGKPHSYQEGEVRHFKNHPLVSSEIAYNIFKRLKFSDDEIKNMCYLIKYHDSLINNEEINNNSDLAKKRFQVQFCDALAHHPLKLEKRIKYLLEINDKLNNGEEKEKYNKMLNELLNTKR